MWLVNCGEGRFLNQQKETEQLNRDFLNGICLPKLDKMSCYDSTPPLGMLD